MAKVMALLPSVPAVRPPGRHALDAAIDGDRAVLTLRLGDGEPVPPLPAGAAAWRVEERVQWDDGGAGAGVTQVSFVRRAAGLSHDDFAAHWSDVHAPLARKHHPGLRRYVQNVVLERLTPDGPDIDGVAELGFASVDDLRDRFYDSPEGKATVGEDVRRFIDLSAGDRVVTRPAPIPSATVVLGRDGDTGFEVLLVQRHTRLEFAGDLWVFPGGRIDAVDADPTRPEDVLAAARRAAVREAAEETGLAVAEDDLVWFSHWTAPPQAPKRFATWFFLAPAPGGRVAIDGGEIVDHRWLSPAAALAARDEGGFGLSPPTYITLSQLAGFGSLVEAVDTLRDRPPEYFATRLATAPGGMVAVYEGDAAYDDPDAGLDRPGGRHRLSMVEDGWRYERATTERPGGA